MKNIFFKYIDGDLLSMFLQVAGYSVVLYGLFKLLSKC